MGHKNRQRRAELRHEFDRLLSQKLEQVYGILLSKIVESLGKEKESLAVPNIRRK